MFQNQEGLRKMQEIVFWSEFPKKVNWNKAKELIDFPTTIYIAIKSQKEFNKYKKYKTKYINIEIWPTLDKKQGYWFSGYTSIKNIDKLKQFKGRIKIDLEPPLPKFKFYTLKTLYWLIFYYFKKPKNYPYLIKTLDEISKKNELIINEFPLPDYCLKKLGIYYNYKTRNMMAYTTVLGPILRPLLRLYIKLLIKIKKPKMCSIGLLKPGIFDKEPYYKNINQFKQDLNMIKNIPVIAIYSLEGILEKPEYLSLLKNR